ncbi:Putative S-adenosyl-L-methionine-dependent methyltransferase [Auxenochlorella protothecoides]|uniref:Putative S-adenosyl-L-methionine-dependent methyltransferase n=1 Tax=Auxenochlorella protothecoides TaxID=3075 RepID=A0A087SSE5_AUXPR|nr:Putative S-adenosyl-L-methionine-dependent methyltransferase [Auxenochlorella protothecoides]KFM28649.1 Putative S-adenosyl-L-methionine-dependent methyltransferase [Auxenochlorella protothecoides]RMZ55482.1 hypothetical protein APUTEX25_000065 [Auxenochlorella protothecoides]|eukprot:RMZ55482.1 hypothetical protein APUTEX25_000065 [Auxenochlorella protothecoides]
MSSTKLRLFNTVPDGNSAARETQSSKSKFIPHANGSSRWGALHALTASWPLELSNLVLQASNPDCTDLILLRFRDHLVPSWRYLSWTVPYFAWHYQNFLEYGLQGGVPGICAYTAARCRWLDDQIRAGVEEGAEQVVILRPGYDTRPYRMRFPHVKFYEVDDVEAHQAKKQLLEAVLPNRNLHPRPAFVSVDWGNLATFIPALTGAGFNPGKRAVFVAEGLLCQLDPEAADTLLSDVSALSAPGSRLAFDFLHEDVLEGLVQPAGYASLAQSLANKGRPFLNGMRPVYSAAVRRFQAYNMRAGARQSLRDAPQPQGKAAHGAALGVGEDGSPDTVEGGASCFVASLLTLICGGGGPAPAPGSARAARRARTGTAGEEKSGAAPLRAPSKETSLAGSRRGPSEHPPAQLAAEPSSDWYLRADTPGAAARRDSDPGERLVLRGASGPAPAPEREALPLSSGGQLPDLDRAQSILPQSSASSLASAAAAAVETLEGEGTTAATARRTSDLQSQGRVQDLRQMFNSLAMG